MALKNKIAAIEVTSFDAALLAGYMPINPGGLTEACFLIRIINNSDEDIDISYDGITDHDFLPMGETLEISFQNNSQPNNNVALIAKGTIVYVAGSGGSGTIYLAGYYSPQY